MSHRYAYDADGRVNLKTWENDSSQTPAYSINLSYGETDTASHGALDTVFKGVGVNGMAYDYFYDAQNRRRLKVYPLGPTDEFFYDLAHQMLIDQGNDSSAAPSFYPDDDYIWLGGRPVVLIRGKLDTSWLRQTDNTGDCTRNGDAAACGFYFPVTDHIGKPVLMLDSQRRVAGTGEFDVFGQVNRVSLDKETPHPYPNNYSGTLADFTQPKGSSSVTVRMRVLLHQLDAEDNSLDQLIIKDGDTQSVLDGPYGGYHKGQLWTAWVRPSNGRLSLSFTSDATNCCPDGLGGRDCACPQYPNFPYTGVVMEGYEYQRFQPAAVPFWTPLRFQGQYADAETDFLENWNRYYDPNIGKYLQPEPWLSMDPRVLLPSAHHRASISAYSYAGNNAITEYDTDGLYTKVGSCQLPDEEKLYNLLRKSLVHVRDVELYFCILGQIENAEIDCSVATKFECVFRNTAERSIGGWTAKGCLKKPTREINWCGQQKSDDCAAKGIIHEMAHTCGWEHGDQKGVPGNDGSLGCQ